MSKIAVIDNAPADSGPGSTQGVLRRVGTPKRGECGPWPNGPDIRFGVKALDAVSGGCMIFARRAGSTHFFYQA